MARRETVPIALWCLCLSGLARIAMAGCTVSCSQSPEVDEFPLRTPTEFFGVRLEGTLPLEAFTCHSGHVVGVRLPPKNSHGKGREVFHYVRYDRIPGVGGLRLYLDIFDASRQFRVYPPIEGVSDEWVLLAARDGYGGHEEQRGFGLGPRRPCAR